MGGLYNIINGYNPACVWVMPLLGRKEKEWPRFRDCGVEQQKDGSFLIVIFTRVGGPNRGQGYGEEELYKDPNYVSTEDWEKDNTYAFYYFKVPEKWKEDFDKLMNGRVRETSKEYQNLLREFYPILDKQGLFDQAFNFKEEEKA